MHYTEFEGVNCRFFEVLGCSGFQICDDKATLPELAEPDKEVVTFRTLQEAAEKIRYYLSRPEKRWAIAEAGYKRAIREHTYEKRIETILSVIKPR
jgi:spore maturation protein CgeB